MKTELWAQHLKSLQRLRGFHNWKFVLGGVSFGVRERRVEVGGTDWNWEPDDFTKPAL